MSLSLSQTIALITVLLPLLIPVGQYLSAILLSRLPLAQQEALKQIGATVVASMEQQAKSGQITPEARKIQAVAALVELAKVAGIKVNTLTASLIVEAAVMELNAFKAAHNLTSPSSPTTPALRADSIPAL